MTEHVKKNPIELETILAQALGYVDVEVSSRADQTLVGRLQGERAREYLPRWARDNGAAYALMVEQKLSPQFMGRADGKGERRSVSDDRRLWAIAYTGDYAHDDEATVRAAIVLGSTAKLEYEALHRPTGPSSTGPTVG